MEERAKEEAQTRDPLTLALSPSKGERGIGGNGIEPVTVVGSRRVGPERQRQVFVLAATLLGAHPARLAVQWHPRRPAWALLLFGAEEENGSCQALANKFRASRDNPRPT